MDRKSIIHVSILAVACLIIFFWISTPYLHSLSLQLTALLLITLILSRHFLQQPSFRLMESTVSTMCVILITSTTGGLSSPFFFLNLFLLFELSLLLEPVIPLFLGAILGIVYFFTHQISDGPFAFFALTSFPFMTPLAYLFGKIYQKVLNQKKEIQFLTNSLEKYKERPL